MKQDFDTDRRDTNKIKDSDFWFRLTFCNYRECKRFQILNIGISEFGPN